MSQKFYALLIFLLKFLNISNGFLYGNGGIGGLGCGFMPPFSGCCIPALPFPCFSPCGPISPYGYGMGNSGFGGFNQGFSQFPMQPNYRNNGNSGYRGPLPECINNQSCGQRLPSCSCNCAEEYICKCCKKPECSNTIPSCPKQKGCGCNK